MVYNRYMSDEEKSEMKQKMKKKVLYGAMLFVALVTLMSSIVRIRVGQIGIVTRFERATGETYDEGMHVKMPFVTKVIKLDTRIQDLEEITTQGELSGRETVVMSVQMKYRLNSSRAVDVYRIAGKNYRDYLMPQSEILDVIKATVSAYNIDEFAQKRAVISGEVLERLNEKFDDRGIIFTSFAISNYNFDAAMETAISEMNTATQEQKTQAIRIQTEKARAAADKEIALTNAEKEAQVAIKKAEAEAQAVRIKAEAEAEANSKVSASVTEELIRYNEIDRWNGSRATVITGGPVVTDAKQE